MDIRLTGVGAVLVVVGLVAGLYSETNFSSQPGGGSAMTTTYPYTNEAIGLAMVGLVLILLGFVMKRKRTAKSDEREGSIGISESEIRG